VGAAPDVKVFLLVFLKTKEDSSFSEEKAAKRLLFLRRFAGIGLPPRDAGSAT
jgi:hypothetical protein